MSKENNLAIEVIKIAIELASIRGNGKETALAKEIIQLVRGGILETFDAEVKDRWSPRYGDSGDRCLTEYSVKEIRNELAHESLR